ncbi:MAG: T9SS type A sorting domain-containing protein [Bacteroidales bacterium]
MKTNVYKLVFGVFITLFSLSLNAQVFYTKYSDTNLVIKQGRGSQHGFNNYDNDNNYWLGFYLNSENKYSCLVTDINLETIDTVLSEVITQTGYYSTKYNDILYFINNTDSILSLKRFNIQTNEFTYINIPYTNPISSIKTSFTKERYFASLIKEQSGLSKILLIDTLGNIMSSNEIDGDYYGWCGENQNSLILLGKNPNQNKIYLIDKDYLTVSDSLNIVNTQSEFFSVKQINDSMFVSASGRDYVDINICNINTKTIANYRYMSDTALVGKHDSRIYFSFTNPDSIYLLCQTTPERQETMLIIEIVNFGINGNFNYKYVYRHLHTGDANMLAYSYPTIDGGLIMGVNIMDDIGVRTTEIIKFKPNDVENIFVSLSNIDINNTCIAYPNPTYKEINIKSESVINSIEIYNSLGQRVYQSVVNSNTKTIDISSFTNGVYILGVNTENGVIRKKIIKN